VSEELDTPQPPMNRMAIAILSLIGLLISVYLTLHKYGYIGSLVCGTGSCETVQASKWAVFMGVPVPVLGLVGYLILFVIALIGLQPRNADSKGIGFALFLLADGAFSFSLYLAYLEQFVIHAWCRWCIASGILATLIWVFSLAEVPRFRRTTT
jgi:uncharacterized membrane protein